MPQISSKAIIETGAKIADDVRIGPFSYIGAEVKIGPGCIIENSVSIVGKTTLGARNRVFPMAVIGTGANSQGSLGECILGDANAIREHVTIDGGQDGPTRIGTDNLIMIGSQIGSSAVVGDHGIFDNLTQIGEQSTIEDYVRTSAFTSIGEKATVGAYTFVAGYVEVHNDAPPFAILMGSPYRVRGVNTENLRRCGFGDDDIRLLKKTFRELFNSQQTEPNLEILNQLAKEPELNSHVRHLLDAIQAGLDKWQVQS